MSAQLRLSGSKQIIRNRNFPIVPNSHLECTIEVLIVDCLQLMNNIVAIHKKELAPIKRIHDFALVVPNI